MNETRKQIIELISDYMDKTLSEGCLIECHGKIYTAITKVYQGKIGILTQTDYGKRFEKVISFRTIGHYDITAVLKYIDDNEEFYWDKSCEGRYADGFGIYNMYSDDFIGDFPKTPLHLYTEQEEKELLELLKKLGPNAIDAEK